MSIVTSVLTGGTNNHETTSEEANGVYTDFVSEGIVGSVGNTSGVAPATGGYAVNAQGTPAMAVDVSTGVAYVTGTPTSQNSQTFRIKSNATEAVAISSNSSGSTKYDWVYIRLNATELNNPGVAGDDAAEIVVSRSTTGASDDGTPPTYGYPIAVVTVANGASSITNGNIRDARTQVELNTGTSNAVSGWNSLTGSVTTATGYNAGNRSFNIATSVDQSAVVSPGMRFKTTRAVTPPTQCTSLTAASSQYASKTLPTGITFTDTFTCSAWVKLSSYAAGTIVGRRNGSTEGWNLAINSSGQVEISGLRIASNNKYLQSYQSVALNKWVHVAATLTMSAGDTTAQKIWIDGVEVPRAYNITGTATSLVQGTSNLVLGAYGSGTNPFPGKLADVRVWSTVRTATQIQDNMFNYPSVTTGLVAHFKLNGDFNDSSTNANNLTASGGAVATNADNPWNATEYGIITKVTSSAIQVFCPEGYGIPNETLSSPFYSTQSAPYGFPRDRGKWTIQTNGTLSNSTVNSPTANTYYQNANERITLPIGAWNLGFRANVYVNHGSTTSVNAYVALYDSIAGSTTDLIEETGLYPSVIVSFQGATANMAVNEASSDARDFTLTTQTTFSLYTKTTGSGVASIRQGNGIKDILYATCNYL